MRSITSFDAVTVSAGSRTEEHAFRDDRCVSPGASPRLLRAGEDWGMRSTARSKRQRSLQQLPPCRQPPPPAHTDAVRLPFAFPLSALCSDLALLHPDGSLVTGCHSHLDDVDGGQAAGGSRGAVPPADGRLRWGDRAAGGGTSCAILGRYITPNSAQQRGTGRDAVASVGCCCVEQDVCCWHPSHHCTAGHADALAPNPLSKLSWQATAGWSRCKMRI